MLQSAGAHKSGTTWGLHSNSTRAALNPQLATPPPSIFQSEEQAPDSGESKTSRNRWRLGSARNKDLFDLGWPRPAAASVPGWRLKPGLRTERAES